MILRLLVHLYDDNRVPIALERESNEKREEATQTHNGVIIKIYAISENNALYVGGMYNGHQESKGQ